MGALHRTKGRALGWLLLLAAAAVHVPLAGQQQPTQSQRGPDIVVFTHISCPQCTEAKRWLAELQRREPRLLIQVRELTEDPRASGDLQQIGRAAGMPSPGVPAWVIGEQVFMVGFGGATSTGRQIERILAELGLPPPSAADARRPPAADTQPAPATGAQPAPAAGTQRARTGDAPVAPAGDAPVAPAGDAPVAPAGDAPVAPAGDAPVAPTGDAPVAPTGDAPVASGRDASSAPAAAGAEPGATGPVEDGVAPADAPLRLDRPAAGALSLPLIGEVDAAGMSLPALTGLIAFVDGFNPCSLWVLTFLLGIVIYSGSRRRVLLVGGLFLLVTALAYGLFIVGMFGTLRYLAYLTWITFVVAAIALAFAAINIKDYFWFRQGVSLTISDRHKPGIFERARNLVHPGRSLPALVAGTVVLALGITLVELPCTAGFPMVWTGIIASQGVGAGYFALLLALYLGVYLSIELAIFGSVVVTMKRSRFEERHGRILKLVGGMIMLALAGTLVLAPDTMHSLTGTLAVFGGALAASGFVLLMHRRVLPRYGIVIGTEQLKAAGNSAGADGPSGPARPTRPGRSGGRRGAPRDGREKRAVSRSSK
jgi:cytochrome c biogenesis protein CcdA/glutaredoxin